MRKLSLFGCLVLINGFAISQNSKLQTYSDSLKVIGKIILSAEDDSTRIFSNKRFTEFMEAALITDNSFFFPFDSVKNVTIQTAPDNSFRIITWTLPKRDRSSYNYFGYLQTYNKLKKTSKIYPLVNTGGDIDNPQLAKLTPANWYGAVYYQMIPCKRHGKMYYVLLGKRWIDWKKSQKIIDVVYISGEKVFFGFPIFKINKKTQDRVLLTYSADVSMSLRYDERDKKITYDHLQPSDPKLEGMYEFYGPDGSYDDFIFKSGTWTVELASDVRNKKDKTSTKLPKDNSHPPIPNSGGFH